MGLSKRPCKGLCGGEFEIARDLDAPLDGAGDGARIRVDSQHALYLLAVSFVCGEVEGLLHHLLLPQTHASQLPLRCARSGRSLGWRWRWSSGYALVPGARNCVRGAYCELRSYGVLRSSHRAGPMPMMPLGCLEPLTGRPSPHRGELSIRWRPPRHLHLRLRALPPRNCYPHSQACQPCSGPCLHRNRSRLALW
jgi:hypothetical protein